MNFPYIFPGFLEKAYSAHISLHAFFEFTQKLYVQHATFSAKSYFKNETEKCLNIFHAVLFLFGFLFGM